MLDDEEEEDVDNEINENQGSFWNIWERGPRYCFLSGTAQTSGFSPPEHSLYCKMTKSQGDFDISLLAIACGIV